MPTDPIIRASAATRKIKFSAVLGLDCRARLRCRTGHYARLSVPSMTSELHQAVDIARIGLRARAYSVMISFVGVTFPLGLSRKAEVRARPGAWPRCCGQAGQSRYFASSPTETLPDSWSGASAAGQATSSTSPVSRLASMPDRIGLPVGRRRGLRLGTPPMASSDSCCRSHQQRTPLPSVHEMPSQSRSSMRSSPLDRPSSGCRVMGQVQIRAHGQKPMDATVHVQDEHL